MVTKAVWKSRSWCKGKSAHAASNYMGDNAIYKMLPVIDAIDKMGRRLA